MKRPRILLVVDNLEVGAVQEVVLSRLQGFRTNVLAHG